MLISAPKFHDNPSTWLKMWKRPENELQQSISGLHGGRAENVLALLVKENAQNWEGTKPNDVS